MSAALPPPMPTNPLRRVAKDLSRERAATVPFPPGELRPSVARTRRVVLDPLPGDGLLTIDGLAHKTARRLLLPAFHHEQVATSVDTMAEEIDRDLARWGDGETRVDIYDWSRHLALRIAMRALLGLDPDARAGGHDPA